MPRGIQLTATPINTSQVITDVTLSQASLAFYNKNKLKQLSEASQKEYEYIVNSFIRWAGEDTLLSTISIITLDDYSEYKLAEGIKPVSMATILRHLRRFFNFCASRNYMQPLSIEMPRVEQEVKEPYTTEEMKALLRRPDNNNWVEYRCWVMVNYFYSTGQRLSTVLNIRVKDIDFENKRVFLFHNKDKIQKFMPLSSTLLVVLEEYINKSQLTDEDYLFPEYEGKQLQRRSAISAIERYNHKRGVQKTSIHLFRHTFAKDYIMNGGNPAKLQRLLNHKTIDMTMHYVNLYANDYASDLDMFNPLENIKKEG